MHRFSGSLHSAVQFWLVERNSVWKVVALIGGILSTICGYWKKLSFAKSSLSKTKVELSGRRSRGPRQTQLGWWALHLPYAHGAWRKVREACSVGPAALHWLHCGPKWNGSPWPAGALGSELPFLVFHHHCPHWTVQTLEPTLGISCYPKASVHCSFPRKRFCLWGRYWHT